MANNYSSENWLVFVDTNIFLDFYRFGGESAERQLKALEKHKDIMITGDQVRMEFLKNRQNVIVEGLKNLTKPGNVQVPPIVSDYQPTKTMMSELKKADTQLKKIKSKVDGILKDPSANDPIYKSVHRIFNHKAAYNLTRPDKQRFEIRNLARKRFVLGYPPRKKGDTSIGDAINWEWIIKCAQMSNENHHILIVSRDGDYGLTYQNETILNDWLRREFKDRVSRKRKIELTNKLTVALKKLDELVNAEDEKEEKRVLEGWETLARAARAIKSTEHTNLTSIDRILEELLGDIRVKNDTDDEDAN